MKARTLSVAGVVSVASLTLTLAAGSEPSPIAPSVSADPPLEVRWVAHEGDLLACRTAAGVLRHLRRDFGDSVLLTAVVPGTSDREYVLSFLRKERLARAVTLITDGDAERIAGTTPAGALYLLVNDSVVVRVDSGITREYAQSDRLATELRRFLPRVVGSRPAPLSPPPLGGHHAEAKEGPTIDLHHRGRIGAPRVRDVWRPGSRRAGTFRGGDSELG